MEVKDIKFDDNSRYRNLPVQEGGDIGYSELPDIVEISIEDPLAIHTASVGETWEILSYKYYGTTKLYWAILYANNIIDPFVELQHGDVIYIPRRRDIPEVK